MSAQQYSRRKALSSLAATVACTMASRIPASADPASPGGAQDCAGPIFSADGPGAWNGKQIVPAQWMIVATTVRASDGYLLPGKATKQFGYGYLVWLFPGERRQFALLGFKGQYICVDPTSKVVMVHTAIEEPVHGREPWVLWSSLVDQLS